ncbi:hypothetical protein [Chondromyces crocatus]|nr:hypothetical protein [Chondromyces crocatus]
MSVDFRRLDPWPERLEVPEVQQHKGMLIRKAQAARTEGYEVHSRTGFRGALYWERWLLTKEPGQHEEARVVSALELSREAGDWKEADLVLVHVDRSAVLRELPFVEHWRKLVEEHLREQVANEQELESAFQEFKKQPTEATVLKVRETADRIAEVGSPIAVHTILARVNAELAEQEEAEMHLMALLVCRPLWVPYAVQLAEHQSRRDIKRAFATIEAGRRLFGPNFWLPL